ncbi:hypothetical protein C9439_03280 [archaeon SCG-AAA382B04]|nr:hypothetical protein C9439_03280 [archaeon SCG-AAA382B04]
MGDKSEYYTSLKKTGLSSILGLLGGVVAYYIAGPSLAALKQKEPFGLLFLLFLVWIQQSLFPLIDVDPDEFSGKDWAFIGLMTLSFGFISWSLLLNL